MSENFPSASLAADSEAIFSRKNVFACIDDERSNIKSTRRKSNKSLIPGRLTVIKSRWGLIIKWGIDEEADLFSEPDVSGSNNGGSGWVMTDSVAFRNSNHLKTDIVQQDEQIPSVDINPKTIYKRFEFEMSLDDLRSFRCLHQLSDTEAVVKFTCKDGTSYVPLHFRGGCNDFLRILQKFVMLKRSSKDNDLILVTDLKTEQLEKSVNVLLSTPDDRDILSKFVHNPYGTALSGLGKVTNFLKDNVVPALLDFDSMTLDEQESAANTIRSYRDLRRFGEDESDHLVAHQESIGFEVITKLQLPPRPEVPRLPPLTDEQWQDHQKEDGQIVNVKELKQIIFRGGVAKRIRPAVWKFLLGYYDFNSTKIERADYRKSKIDEYYKMKLQWKSFSLVQEENFVDFRDRKALIEKDVARTDRSHPYFQGEQNAHVNMQYDILMTYCMFNFDLGYVQGMSDLLSPIMVVMENEVDSFWTFVGYMEKVYGNFEMDQESIKQQLMQLRDLLMTINPSFLNYLESHDSDNMFFCFRWLLIWFKREFSVEDIMNLWEVLWTEMPCKNFHMLICLAILDKESNFIMENKFGFTEILKHVNDLSMHIDVGETISRAEGIYHQLAASQDKLPTHICEVLGFEIEEGLEVIHDSSSSSKAGSPEKTPSSLVKPFDKGPLLRSPKTRPPGAAKLVTQKVESNSERRNSNSSMEMVNESDFLG